MQFAELEAGPTYLDVPPDVTTGRLVVVVGGIVVVVGGTVVGVVVGGLVAGAGVADDGLVAGEEVVVAGAAVVAVVVVEPEPAVPGCAVVGTVGVAGAFELAEDPGCSLATMTPMKAAAPPATTMVVRVRRRTRACAWARAAGECRAGLGFTASDRGVVRALARGGSDGPRLGPGYGPYLKES